MPGYKRKRGKDAWQLIVTAGTDFSGKPVRFTKTVHCSSEAEADKELALFYADCIRGTVNRSTPTTIKDLSVSFMDEHVKRFCKRSVQETNRSAIDTWILPNLGEKKITKLTRTDVQHWVNSISDAGRSPKTVRNIYSVLRTMFTYALNMGLIDQTPCEHIKMPRKDKKEANFFNESEVKVLLAAIESLPDTELRYKCAVLLGLFCGMRKGEILGLNWDDIDLSSGKMHIQRTRMIDRSGGGIYEDTPKTEKSNRYITVPGIVIEELIRLKAQQAERMKLLGSQYEKTDALLQGELGGPMYPQVLQRWFTRFCKKNDLPTYGLHSLRHTHASMLAKLGTDKMQISTRLGHSQLSTTLNIYTHLFEEADRAVADDINRFVDKMLTKAK